MSTVEIKYTFDSYEDREEIEELQNYKKYSAALWDLNNYVRSLTKYSEKESISIDELSEHFWEIIKSYEISLS